MASPAKPEPTDEALQRAAWRALLAASSAARSAAAPLGGPDALDWLIPSAAGWSVAPAAPAPVRAFLELYAPVCARAGDRPFTIAHLGQSLDGWIATETGDSYYVTGPDNVVHLHRLRALCDAVVVGAGTIACDDPLLTVRHVEGENPLRVIIDPRRRLKAERRVFADDAPTLLIYGDDAPCARSRGHAEVAALPLRAGRLDLVVLLDVLRERGCRAAFVEGGGATVSRFLEADLLDRLQIAIAPLVIGSGRPGLSLPARDRIAECLRPAHRVFAMGGDVLFDCNLRAPSGAAHGAASSELKRII